MGPTVDGVGEAAGPAPEFMARVVAEVVAMPESKGPLRQLAIDLARRVKLLAPLFDELIADDDGFGGGATGAIEGDKTELGRGLAKLYAALVAAKDFLRSVNEGSKLYQAKRRAKFTWKFIKVTEDIEKALDEIPYNKLDISEEVKEQIELVHTQLRRAQESIDLNDLQLQGDLNRALSEDCDPSILTRISEKLQLRTINDMKKESIALHEMVISTDGEPDVCLDELSTLLKKLTDCLPPENATSAIFQNKTSFMDHRSPIIPDEFRCPISLELMKDPVIVSTGQTYERSGIQKWLDAGHRTCPKTQQHLSHAILTPNFVLKSLIAQWCDANGIELPKKQGVDRDGKTGNHSSWDRADINSLLHKLENGNHEEQRAAAGELRLLAKRNADNRICIAQAGAIPLLVGLLSSADQRTQEHAVTALLNLSINESNKDLIVQANAIPKIVEVLRSGSMEARENAAATLFSLSVVDHYKILIGEAGAVPPLVSLLCQGSPRGKKDAATAIFNLCIYQGNKVKAVKAGIVTHLMQLLADPSGGMVDESLALLAILAGHSEGKAAIAQSDPMMALLELMKAGSPRNRENAAAVLCALCTGDLQAQKAARDYGAEEAVKDLIETGTERAKRKAGNLLEIIRQPAEGSGVGSANM